MSEEITFYISIISSCLLAVSEVLPYINSIQSNGVLETLINLVKTKTDNYTPTIIPTHNDSIVLEEILKELKSSKEFLHSYLNDKKINISIN